MPDTSDVGVVRRFYAAFAANDPAEFDAVLHPDWELEPPLFGAPGTREGEKGTVAFLHGVLADVTYTVEEIHDCGDGVVAARNTLRATQTGPFLGLSPAGGGFAMMTMELHRVRDGRIVHTWHLEDFYGVEQQLRASGARPLPEGQTA